ncbi:MAG: two-component system cell cycle sensor histidine kinase/response regulator CckA [Verrucomicrobiales bacterium]|jgi:two-component system cell cycle sensor histidine kinase/response regulator CckA
MAITGYSSMLTEGAETHPELLEDIQAINHSVERASALTRKLLAFGRQSNQRAPLKANEIIRNLKGIIRSTLGDQIKLDLTANEAAETILADRQALEQIILNITQNARDAMSEGGSFKISTHRVNLTRDDSPSKGKFVQIRLTDTGPGIPKILRDRIFDPFFTTKPRHEGAGLGLSTVYAYAQRMGVTSRWKVNRVKGAPFLSTSPPAKGPMRNWSRPRPKDGRAS